MKPINFANLRLYRMYFGNRKLVQLPGLIRQWQERQRNKHLTKQLQAVQSLVLVPLGGSASSIATALSLTALSGGVDSLLTSVAPLKNSPGCAVIQRESSQDMDLN